MQFAPYIGAGVGVAIGAAGEHVLQKKVSEERQPLNEILGDTAGEIAPSTGLNRLGRKVLGPVAVACAIAGGANGLAWQEGGDVEIKTQLQIVVDRSGSTGREGLDGQKPATLIDNIITEFAEHKETKTNIVIGKGGEVLKRTSDQVLRQRPIGDAPMRRAFRSAVDNISSTKVTGDNTKNAVVVITNGNAFGETESVLDTAKDANISVFVKNVNNFTDGTKIQQMREIAQKTGGVYLDNTTDPEKMYEQVKDKANGRVNAQEAGAKHEVPEKIFTGLLSLFVVGAVARARRRMPLTFNGTKIEK